MTRELAADALNLLSPILMAALTWAATRVSRFISERIRNEKLRGVLLRLDDVVMSVVKETFQVTVEALKAATPDGKLPAATAGTIKAAALTAIKAQLGPKGLGELTETLGLTPDAADRLLSTKVEAAVYSIKHAEHTNGVSSPGGFLSLMG
jgi:hypothetical protein